MPAISSMIGAMSINVAKNIDDLFDSQSWELVDAGHSDTSLGCIRYTLCKDAREQ